MEAKQSAYAAAGVDIDKKMGGIETIKQMVKKTVTPGVIGGIGSFGGLFQSPGADTILVASTDGVGTKLKVAAMAGRHDTVGQDIVNHCVNDILVQGATPLFFLDYIGASVFDGAIFNQVVSGLCKACAENGCALLGGETAEMPGLYPVGEYDLVGTIVGQVKKSQIITGERIGVGDVLIGLPSGGLQTNGFSLARKVIFEQEGLKPEDTLPGTASTCADALLAIHKSFLKPVNGRGHRHPRHGPHHRRRLLRQHPARAPQARGRYHRRRLLGGAAGLPLHRREGRGGARGDVPRLQHGHRLHPHRALGRGGADAQGA